MAILRFLPSCVGEKFLSRASFFAAVAIAIRFRDGSYRPAPQCMSGRGEEKSVGAGEGSCHRRCNRGGSAVCNKYRLDDISLTFSLLPPPPPRPPVPLPHPSSSPASPLLPPLHRLPSSTTMQIGQGGGYWAMTASLRDQCPLWSRNDHQNASFVNGSGVPCQLSIFEVVNVQRARDLRRPFIYFD